MTAQELFERIGFKLTKKTWLAYVYTKQIQIGRRYDNIQIVFVDNTATIQCDSGLTPKITKEIARAVWLQLEEIQNEK